MSVCVFFLLFFLCVSNIDGASRTVTNEDIRDAILSIVNVIRSTEDKLERHEFRERTLGDQLKKVLSIIDKRQRLFDPIKGTIGRLDQRLATVETILLQKDERERIQVQRVFDMVEQIHRSLPQLFETLKNDITSSFSSGEEKQQDVPNNVEIEKLQKQIANKIDDTSSTVKSIEGQLSQIREENKNNFSSTHKFMEQYDNKLKEYNKQFDIIPSRCKQVTDLQTDVILKALVTQDLNIKKLQAEVNGANATIRDLQQKIGNIHGNIENGQKDVKETLKELVKDSRQNYQNYDSKLSAYKDKMDAIPTIYKNGTEAQTKELLKVFQTHDANLKQLQNELIKLNANTKTLPEQHVKIIDKLGPMTKLINNGDLLLSQSKATQDALNKIGNANEQLKKLDLLPKLIDNDNLLLKQSKAAQDAVNKQIGNGNEQLKKLDLLPKLIDNDNLLLSQSKAVQDALNRQIGNGNEQLKKLDLLSKLIDNDNLLLSQSKAAQDALNRQIGNTNEQLKKLDLLPKLIDNDNLLLSQSKAAQDAINNQIGNANEQLKKLDFLPKLIDNDNLLLSQSKAAQDALNRQIANGNEQLKKLDLLPKLIDNDNLLLKESKAAQDAINNQIGDANKIDNTVKNAMKKLMDNDNLLLSQSKAAQEALNKQLENQVKAVSDQLKKMAEEIPKGRDEMIKALNSELPRKIDASEESIRKKMLELQNSWKTTDQQLAELPKKQQADEIMKALNDELPKKFEDFQQKLSQLDSSCRTETKKHLEESQKRQGDELVKVLKREFELTTKNSARQLVDDLKGYTNESKTQRGLILEAVNVQKDEILDRITKSCSDKTDLLKKALEVQTKQVKKLEKHIENKTLSTNDALQAMQTNLAKIDENAQKHGDISEGIKKNITIHNELLQKYNAKLDDYHAEYRELRDMQNIREILDNHTTSSWELQKGVNDQLSDIRSENAKILETAKDLTKLLNNNNKTTECNNSASLEEIKNVTADVRSSLEDLKKKSDNTKLLDSMKLLEELTDSLNTNIALSFGKLMDEMNNLEKLEEIVRQTGDGVVDTKRRVEYGVHQISTEVSNLIKAQTKELSTGLNTRFNNLETSLLDEDEGILANLTTKTAQEVDQVWKQIGMMHQQLTSTNELISGLVSRADRFANGTATTMDTMRGKIGIITSRVIEVGNNLNTLLGRISLISQEFNIIKKELGNTLNEMKRQTVENRMRPPPPTGSSGPYPVNRI